MTNDKTLLTPEEFGALARIGKTLRQQILKDGSGPPSIRIGRKRLILRETALQWLRDQEMKGRAA